MYGTCVHVCVYLCVYVTMVLLLLVCCYGDFATMTKLTLSTYIMHALRM